MIGSCNTGGGGLNNRNALLRVTCPAGATVTAAKGGVTISPQIWTQAGSSLYMTAVFVLSPSKFDSQTPWVMTAVRNGQTKTASVIVSEAKEYDVPIAFEIYFIKNGLFTAEATHAKGGYANSIVSENANGYVEFTTPIASQTYSTLYFSAVTRGAQNYLVFDGQWRGFAGSWCPAFGVLASLSANGSSPSVFSPGYLLDSSTRGSYANRSVKSLAIDSAESSVQVALQMAGSQLSEVAGGLRIYNLYLTETAPA